MLRTVLQMAARLAVAALAFLLFFAVAYGVLLAGAPAGAPADGPIPPAVALLLTAVLNTAVVAWLILRARRRG